MLTLDRVSHGSVSATSGWPGADAVRSTQGDTSTRCEGGVPPVSRTPWATDSA